MDEKSHQILVDLVMSFYVGEPCRICGMLITKDDLNKLVYAGYSKNNQARSAHGKCWQENKPKSEWVYSEDEISKLKEVNDGATNNQ